MATKKATKKSSKKVATKPVVKKDTHKKVSKKTTHAKKEVVTHKPSVDKKDKTVEKKKSQVSDKIKTTKDNNWMVATAIMLVIVVILVGAIVFIYMDKDKVTDTPVILNLTNSTEGPVELLIVEDPACVNCQTDVFATQIKENLINDLVIKKYSLETPEGKAFVDELKLKQLPVYLFSKGISKRDDWEGQLSQAFIRVNVQGSEYYMLNPQIVPTKIMIEEPKVMDNAIIIGDKNAPVTIVEFTDFECPFCAIAEGNPELVEQFSVKMPGYVAPMPKVVEEYVENGKVKIVFYNNPIASLHPLARTSHLAALCANEQDKFEEYANNLWAKRSEWSSKATSEDRVAIMKTYAKDLELKEEQFNTCLDTKKYDAQIDEELKLAQEYGVSGTPAFFVGKNFISGAQEYTVFDELIKSELAE